MHLQRKQKNRVTTELSYARPIKEEQGIFSILKKCRLFLIRKITLNPSLSCAQMQMIEMQNDRKGFFQEKCYVFLS